MRKELIRGGKDQLVSFEFCFCYELRVEAKKPVTRTEPVTRNAVTTP